MASNRQATTRDEDGLVRKPEPSWTALLSPHPELAFSAINCGYQSAGMATVLIARRLEPAVLCAHFVVDLLAFGVTDCFGEAFENDQFEVYLADVDKRLPLEWCSPQQAAEVVQFGAEQGHRNGIPQPESLSMWSRILPELPGDSDLEQSVFGHVGCPLAVPDLLPKHRARDAGGWLVDELPETPIIAPRVWNDH